MAVPVKSLSSIPACRSEQIPVELLVELWLNKTSVRHHASVCKVSFHAGENRRNGKGGRYTN